METTPSTQTAPFAIRNIDVKAGLARFAGDEERYRHWLIDFVSHGPSAAEQIRQAITNGSQEAATKLAHALKGRTGMLGMIELYSISLALEMALRHAEPTSDWLAELEKCIASTARDIAATLADTPPA